MLFASLFLSLFYLVCFVIISCEGDERFTIRRRSDGSRNDQFTVPRSKCSWPLACRTLYSGATNHDPTQCKCACGYEYSTFGFYSGRWICLGNNQVRKQPGCQFWFDGEHTYEPLWILSTGVSYRIIFPSFDCTIDQSASRYRKCDGTWASISVQSNSFRFLPITENLGFGQYRHTMKVGTVTALAGRIVSLKVNCKNPTRSSCVLFKMAGQITCPVNITTFSSSTQPPSFTVTSPPTTQPVASDAATMNSSTEAPGLEKGASNSGENGGSSGTVAALVIIILLVIIVAAIVGFVIWKRRRGENILLIEHLISIASKFRSPPPTKKPEEPEEQIYAEIPEHPAQRQTPIAHSAPAYAEIYSYAFNDPNSAYAPPNQHNNTTSPKLRDEASTDERGYMMPVDSPLHNDVQDNNQHNTDSNCKNKAPNKRWNCQMSTSGGGVRNNDLVPYYDVLEVPDEQTTENNVKHTPVYNRQADRDRAGSSHVRSSAVPGTEDGAGNNRYVPKQRRRPPSPPRKI